ncbi:MAG: T9SS type A sorting domain-containing protein, partial [Bacteroidales bacterium]|nr:T9SS type A sorting domain-containing protein [Bacteroidales bacterium]
TFTEGMNFGYDGVNPYNKYYIEPVNPAFTIFQSQEISYGCGIAYDADDYKTIASSYEFGALVDGEFPSTKLELMGQYLYFFGIDNPIVSVDENNNSLTENEISNYPNPFTEKTYITFRINENSKVTLEIFNLNGQLIKTLIDNEVKSGTHKIIWNGKNVNNKSVPSGVYFYKLKTNSYQKTGKLVYIE